MTRGARRGNIVNRLNIVLISAVAAIALLAHSDDAKAYSPALERACKSDWRRLCSAHSPGSRRLRSCMRANGRRLSRRCINALVRAGEISRRQLRRYKKRYRRRR